ncbi:MAG: hypothetical protein R3344_00530 [Acidobacteriota bacterium]|nr:hypothetical protein [Acidobacteriota bacterium]
MFWNDPNLYGVTLPYKEHLPLMWQNYPKFVPPTFFNFPATHTPYVRPELFRPDIYGQQMVRPDIYSQQFHRPEMLTHAMTGYNPFFTHYGMTPPLYNFYRPFI